MKTCALSCLGFLFCSVLFFVVQASSALADGPTLRLQQEVEPNNSDHHAQDIELPAAVAATIQHMDRDVFRFSVDAPAMLRVSVTAVEGCDFSLHLYDANRRSLLAVDGRPEGKPESFVYRVRRDSYYLHVLGRRTARNSAIDSPYRLTVVPYDPARYEPPTQDIEAAIRRGLAYLAQQQEADGGWAPAPYRHGVSGLALMAFLGEKNPQYKPMIERSVAFFKQSYQAPTGDPRNATQDARMAGSLVGKNSRHFIYEQAIAVLAMSGYAGGAGEEDTEARAMVTEAIRLLLRSQNTGEKPAMLGGPIPKDHQHFGGWKYMPSQTSGDISVSGWCLIALVAARAAGFDIAQQAFDDYVAFARRCFNENQKGYGYLTGGSGRVTGTSNAVGVLGELLCGKNPECPMMRTGVRHIMHGLPVWNKEGGSGRHPFYYWYYASRAMYVAGGAHWQRWRSVVCPMLLDHQNEDGSWDTEDDETVIGKNYSTALAVLILQLCAGNPPSYLKGLELRSEPYPCHQCINDIETVVRKATTDRTGKEELISTIQALIERYRGD